MSVFAHVDGLGDRIEECVTDSVLCWRREFAARGKYADVIAEALRGLQTAVDLRPGGYARVVVTLRPTKRQDQCSHVFRLYRRGSGRWERIGSSLNL